MAKSRERFQKRQRERAKQEKAAAKRARRDDRAQARSAPDDAPADEAEVDHDQLLEEFRVLSERHAAGEVSPEEFEERRAELAEQLGLA